MPWRDAQRAALAVVAFADHIASTLSAGGWRLTTHARSLCLAFVLSDVFEAGDVMEELSAELMANTGDP